MKIRSRTLGRKLWLLAGMAVVIAVLVAEFVLHLVGYPYDPDTLLRSHFVPEKDGWMVTRPLLTRIETSAYPQRIRREKATEVFRVALLGGSNVKIMGDARPLKEMLEQKLGRNVEILNFGLCGCGSDRVLVTAGEALRLDVDAVLVYSGHNEFVSESNRSTYRQAGWLHRHSRILQLCIGNAWIPEPGRLYTPKEKKEVYKRFESNLRELALMCRDAGVPLVWGTLVSNITVAPIVYIHKYYGGIELPSAPLLKFKQGVELFNSGNYPEAKRLLQEAIDDSPRPWRATLRTNEILRDVAGELSVPLADVEQSITDAAQHGIPGNDLFSDYCHVNEHGCMILFKAFTESLTEAIVGGE